MAKFYTNTQFQSSVQLESTVMNAMDARIQAGFQLISQALSDMGSGDYVLDNPDLTTELKVVASTPADMRVHVSTGVASVSGLLCQNEATKSLRIAAPTTNNRYTIVQISNYGEISTVNGVEAGSPVEPSADADNMKLCAIYLPQSTTKIENTDGGFGYIIDRRVLWGYGFSQVGDNYGFGTTTPDRRVDILDTTGPQLRLTYTDNTIYGDIKVDSNGYFSIVSTGKRYGINTTSPASMLDVRDTPVGTAVFDGVGLDDLTVTIDQNYWYFNDRWILVEIDGTSPDTITYGLCSSGDFSAIVVEEATLWPISVGANNILENVTINFGADTGHTIGDKWEITIPAPASVITCHGIDVAQPGGTNWRALRMSELDVLIGGDVCADTLYEGYANTAGGNGSMWNAGDARYNASWGYKSLRLLNNGAYNTAIGAYAIAEKVDPEGVTALGYYAGKASTGDFCLYLGHKAGANATGDYQLYVDVSDTATPLIWGNFDTNLLTVHGSLGIGTKTPTALLQLSAGTIAAGTAPLKFTSGPLLTTPEAGAVEFLTDAYYATITTGPARKTFAFLESPAFTTPNIGVAVATSIAVGTSPATALLHLGAGTIAVGTSPLKFTSGPLLTTPEAGAIEFLTDAFYATITTGPARKTLAFLESPAFTTPNIGVATATSIAIGANVLDTNEWAFLDSQDQGVKIASTPRFARLGLGVAADATIPFKSLHASSPQIQLTNVDGSVFVDIKADTSGNLCFMPSGGNLNIVVSDGAVVTYDDEVVLVF